MTLSVDVEKALGNFALAASVASSGHVTALFGRSGAGKTTLVNLIAGLIAPDRGAIRLDDVTFVDTRAGVNLPAHKRGVGYVFQEGRLFPHLSVRANLAYGRRFAAQRGGEPTLAAIADLLDIGALLDRRPADLSGGEKQRVAIGRALLANPRLLLMDEPLAALDAQLKEEILPYIERLRDETRLPMVYVSHQVDEVARLADTVVLLAGGKAVASGSVNDVFSRFELRPHTGVFEAGVVLSATIARQDADSGSTELAHAGGTLVVPAIPGAPGAAARLRVRARDVTLAVGEPGRLSIRNRLAGTVAEISPEVGGQVEVRLDVGGEPLLARVTPGAVAALELAVGKPVVALIKATSFDRAD